MKKQSESPETTPIATQTRVPPDGYVEDDEDDVDKEPIAIPTQTRVP